jgi:outer membrane receptor for ferrienterochelin and colicin
MIATGLLVAGVSHGQIQSIRVIFENVTLDEAIQELSLASGVNIVYSPDLLPSKVVDVNIQGRVTDILTQLLRGTNLSFRTQDEQIILFSEEFDQTPFIISGYVEDLESGERLIGAHLIDIATGGGSATNEYGFFSIQTRGGIVGLKTSFLGYQTDTIFITRTRARGTQKVSLRRLAILPGVIIDGEQNNFIVLHPLTSHHFNERQLASKSFLGGEIDVQRYIETQPGVSTGIDGIGGMHIRGGNGDQNLILFDGVPIYHATHAIGILSVFNPLMIREVTLQKGEYPARYSGRLSSVLDVRTKEGSNKQWALQSSIGLATVNAVVEGPVIKDKVGILVAGRRFIPGFYLRNLSSHQKADEGLSGETNYAFADLNAKCNISLTPKDRLYLSIYYGDDSYNDLTGKFTRRGQSTRNDEIKRELNWGSTIGVFRWNHQFGEDLFANLTMTLSSFELQSLDRVEFLESTPGQGDFTGFVTREFKSRIKDASARLDFDHYISNSNRLRYGLTYTRHVLSPKSIAFDDEARLDSFFVDELLDDALFSALRTNAIESGVYLEDEHEISDLVKFSGGVHVSAFDVREQIYWAIQPRMNISLKVADNLYAHAGAGWMTQYLHLLTSSGIGLPTDLWVPATQSAKPQRSFQVSTGMAWRISKQLKVHADIYTRRLRNLVTYREGASFLLRETTVPVGILDAANWEDKITQGSGKARGFEFASNYSGKIADLELAYTYSHSTRQFPELNSGKTFPFRFDRRHALSLSGLVHINDQFTISVSWNYASGVPITLAQLKFENPSSVPSLFPNVDLLEFSERNAYRLPSYHRLDLGAAYVWRMPKATHSIHLDLYNAYNQDNVLYVALTQDDNGFRNQQYTVLPFIPSLSYQLKL